jgi:hypothetical protein
MTFKQQGFIQSTLNTSLNAPGVPDILDFHLYPWGNAYFNIATCGASPYYDKSVMFCWVKACGAGA